MSFQSIENHYLRNYNDSIRLSLLRYCLQRFKEIFFQTAVFLWFEKYPYKIIIIVKRISSIHTSNNGAREKFLLLILHFFSHHLDHQMFSSFVSKQHRSWITSTRKRKVRRNGEEWRRIATVHGKEKLLRINYYATSTPFQSYCQSRNNRELRIHGDIDVIFSARCAVACVTGLIRDVQEIFLIKEKGPATFNLFIPTFHLIPLLIAKIICFENLYRVDWILSLLVLTYLSRLTLEQTWFSTMINGRSNGWLFVDDIADRSSQLNSLIEDIYHSSNRIYSSRCTWKPRFVPTKPIARGETHSHKHGARLNSKRPKAASFVRSFPRRTKVDHVTRSLPSPRC